MKILLRLFARSFFNFSLNPNLPLHFHPIHQERRVWIFFELTAFVAGVVGKKNKPALIEILEQYDASGWLSIHACGQRHRVGIMNPGFSRSGKPDVKLFHRVGIEIRASQSSPDVFVPETSVIERRLIHTYATTAYDIRQL